MPAARSVSANGRVSRTARRTVVPQAANRAAVLCHGWVEQRELGLATIDHVQPVGFPSTFQNRPFVRFTTAVGSHLAAGGTKRSTSKCMCHRHCTSPPLVGSFAGLFPQQHGLDQQRERREKCAVAATIAFSPPPPRHPASLSLLQRVPMLSTFPLLQCGCASTRTGSCRFDRPVMTGTRLPNTVSK
jgi:hypothetical protein